MSGVRFGRFNLVGLLGAGVQLAAFHLLAGYFHLPGVAAAPLAVEIAVLHNFCWHERFTWRDRRLPGLRESALRLCRLQAANGVLSIAGNTVLIYLFTEGLGFPAEPSAAAAILLCSLANYAAADRWVFAPPTPPTHR